MCKEGRVIVVQKNLISYLKIATEQYIEFQRHWNINSYALRLETWSQYSQSRQTQKLADYFGVSIEYFLEDDAN